MASRIDGDIHPPSGWISRNLDILDLEFANGKICEK
jgi:hypothetical protein